MEAAKAIKQFTKQQIWPGIRLDLVSAGTPPPVPSEDLEEMVAYCQRYGYQTEGHNISGPAAKTLMGFAHEAQANLLILGASFRASLLRRIFGSVAMDVVRRSDLPLFLSH